MRDFRLHSHGPDWFHFRVDQNSAMESFSVTYVHDGTCVMTGDMGVLAWQRRIFPDKADYCFPTKDTGIHYFSEKVVRAGEAQNIYVWDKEGAKKDILSSVDDYDPEHHPKELLALKSVYDQVDGFEDGEYGRVQMYEAFSAEDQNIEGEDMWSFGQRFTPEFKMRFEMLQSVSDQILEYRPPSTDVVGTSNE